MNGGANLMRKYRQYVEKKILGVLSSELCVWSGHEVKWGIPAISRPLISRTNFHFNKLQTSTIPLQVIRPIFLIQVWVYLGYPVEPWVVVTVVPPCCSIYSCIVFLASVVVTVRSSKGHTVVWQDRIFRSISFESRNVKFVFLLLTVNTEWWIRSCNAFPFSCHHVNT